MNNYDNCNLSDFSRPICKLVIPCNSPRATAPDLQINQTVTTSNAFNNGSPLYPWSNLKNHLPQAATFCLAAFCNTEIGAELEKKFAPLLYSTVLTEMRRALFAG